MNVNYLLLLEKIAKTVEIDIKKLEIEEEGIRLRLTVVDTPGFNDAINSTERLRFTRIIIEYNSIFNNILLNVYYIILLYIYIAKPIHKRQYGYSQSL